MTLHGVESAFLRVAAHTHVPPHPTPIVLLHGWGIDSVAMTPIADRLSALGYTCIVPDFPGFGASATPSIAWTVRDYADWSLALLDALDIRRAHLFAHSFGARVALILGADHADRLDKIVLTGAAGVPSRRSLSARVRLTLYKAVRSGLHRLGAAPTAERLAAWYSARYGSADYQAAIGVMRQTFLNVVNQDLRPVAARVSRPTLLFWGDHDEATPLWQGRLLESLIPDAGLIVYEGGDHYAYLQRAAELCRTLDHFLRH
ncbi:MAG: alpha/beta hydrolase [Chloroflexota bacterium]|nr:alpha/beta hydrolase [Chloroflexota bacterium]